MPVIPLMRYAIELVLLVMMLPAAAQTPPVDDAAGETSFFRGGADRTGYYDVEPMDGFTSAARPGRTMRWTR
jgi:hypothetical protein